MKLAAPFTAEASEVVKTEQRFAGRQFGEKDGLMFVTEFNRDTNKRKIWMLDYRSQSFTPRLVSDLSINERYNDIGNFVNKRLPNGYNVVMQDGDDVFTSGQGATPEGDRPFLRRFSLKDMKATEIFRSGSSSYESFVTFGKDKSEFITRFETVASPPNLMIHSFNNPIAMANATTSKPLTEFKDPTPQLRGIKKQLVKYKRADGVDCSFTLYLPPNYQEGTRLPAVVWAYPLEFTDASTAGQVSGSDQPFYPNRRNVASLFPFARLRGFGRYDDADCRQSRNRQRNFCSASCRISQSRD